MPGATKLDVFAFVDYRAYLREYYALGRKRRLSFRAFSQRAGLRSPNYLKLVIDGQRNLSLRMADRFARACGLSGDAQRYFEELVRFDLAPTLEERNVSYKRLSGFRRFREIRTLEAAQYEYHSHWYLPAIRELALRRDFRADPEWIASVLVPQIRVSEAESALRTLEALGLLLADETGQLRQASPLLTTGAETASLHVANYHAAMMAHAARAMRELPQELRDISSLTLCLGPGGLSRTKRALQRFRRELLAASETEENPVQVVQLNFQLFPLSRADVAQEAP